MKKYYISGLIKLRGCVILSAPQGFFMGVSISIQKVSLIERRQIATPSKATIEQVQNRLIQDIAALKKSITSFHFIESNPKEVISCCSSLRSSFLKMFQSPENFKQVWNAFRNSAHFQDCQIDLKKEPIEDLSDMGYHNIGHAKEMYCDTYLKLLEAKANEAICQAGATMAFFHDLVQGLDGYGGDGENENVTAKLLKFLIDEKFGKEGNADVKNALHDLCDATIVGGTYLFVTTDENGNEKNLTPSEAIDYSDVSGNEVFQKLQLIRRAMAENDIARTNNKNSYCEPHLIYAENPVIKARNEAIAKRNAAVYADEICKKFIENKIPLNMIGRTMQSLRMVFEIMKNFDKITAGKNEIVNQLNIFIQSEDEISNENIKIIIEKLKSKETWKGQSFSEASFALKSGHEEYANMLNNINLCDMFAAYSNQEIAKFILLVLTDGQDGHHIQLPEEI